MSRGLGDVYKRQARDYIQWTLDNIKANNKKISYIGRSPDASPATGYAKRHISQQQEIIKKVLNNLK